MRVIFKDKEYRKNARQGYALKNLCFDIFKHYLDLNKNLNYHDLQNLFNQWHCNNNFVVLSKADWENKTEDLKKRYFEPVEYNNQEIYFTTQWGNNGGNCDNVNNMIKFAKQEGYDIKVIDSEMQKKVLMNIKNIILYGAPGVGKTHNYKNLIAMIEEGNSQKEIFETILNNLHVSLENETFETIKKEKRVEFVTFHQSYSYEDFIEGYRPDENSNNIIRKDGIFKLIADEARKNLEDSSKSTNEYIEEKKISEIFKEFCEYISDEIIEKNKFDINNTAYIFEVEKDAFRYKGDNWSAHESGLRMKFSDILEFYNKNIQERKEIKDLENISRLSIQHATYYFKVYELFKKFKANIKQTTDVIIENKQQNFYIVIDEINRGNISKIFGELITLIEEDKRDKYEVTLPYSKEPFKVPSNLYIIATMNSTDKSIATIDIALRRRFTFLKMKPKAELVKDDNAKKLFNELNDFIKEKLSEDYMLGHSYFMNIQNSEELDFVKEYKIKPLLEEYFYADDESFKKALAILENHVEITE
ncbi:AAA family ATPase [Sulfurimonas sp. HSL-1716]|uniref:McrB family protein n=1 Tax=Hydrocurvibacter sulfurireducens TaxID=3131937 RepID=UPI0031FA383B